MTDTTVPELSEADKKMADELIEKLKKEAEYEAWLHMSAHVPAEWQAYFLASNPDPSQAAAPAAAPPASQPAPAPAA